MQPRFIFSVHCYENGETSREVVPGTAGPERSLEGARAYLARHVDRILDREPGLVANPDPTDFMDRPTHRRIVVRRNGRPTYSYVVLEDVKHCISCTCTVPNIIRHVDY